MATHSSNDTVIEARGLTKVFRDFWGRPKARAVNGVDFTVARGQVFGLLGPNGSGKSTTVKMLLGLLYPTRGKLEVLGESPRRVDTKRRIGYLPEDTYLYRYLTATETLDFFGALFGLAPGERRKRAEQLLEMVGLSSARNRPVGEFSKGMARRIGLAQALVNDPELVILDEPTSGLDPIGCREVKDVIQLLASRGKTVLLCSHLLADVEDVCDEVLVLYGGRVCASGPLRDMLRIEDKTRITAPRLPAAELERLLALLRQILPDHEPLVDHPSMNLEEFFLEVVRRAREASLDTAGAKSGGQIAEYLRPDGADAVPGPVRLANLVVDTPPPPSPPAPAPTESTSKVDTAALDKLAAPDAPTPAAPPTTAPIPAPPPPANLAEASEKLKKLLDR